MRALSRIMMTRFPVSILVIICVLAVTHGAIQHRPAPFNVHLYRSKGTQYDHGSGLYFDHIMRTIELPRIQKKLDNGSSAILIHGMMGSGKSSIIERLMVNDQFEISSGINIKASASQQPALGHTKNASDYQLEIDHDNRFVVIDTPGLDERHDVGKVMVQNAIRQAVQRLSHSDIALNRLYFVIDPTHRNVESAFLHSLQVLKDLYGDETCRKMRLVVNKSDQLARDGQDYIERQFVDAIQKLFRQVFGVHCSNIIFTCSDIYSPVCCIGQLIDDICSDDIDIISVNDSDVEQRVLKATSQLQGRIAFAEVLDSLSITELNELRNCKIVKRNQLDREQSCSQRSFQQARTQLSNQKQQLQALHQICTIVHSPDTISVQSEAEVLCKRFRDCLNPEILFFTQNVLQTSTDLSKIVESWFIAVENLTYTDIVSFWEAMNPQSINQNILHLKGSITQAEDNVLATERILQLTIEQIRQLEQEIDSINERL